MTRLPAIQRESGTGQESRAALRAPHADQGVGPPGEPPHGPYEARPVRPVAQAAARIALWGAVAFGCIGGVIGLVRPSPAPPEPASSPAVGDEAVPGPVAAMAEMVVEAWLVAGAGDDTGAVEALFVDRVSLADARRESIVVGDVTAVAGRTVQDGYWAVTVAAQVTEPSADALEEDGAEVTTTWYVEVGIVGEVDSGLAALTTPAVVPTPPAVEEGWRRSNRDSWKPGERDPLVVTVQGFLRALLAGEGDPSRYMIAGASSSPADPPPFADLVVLAAEVTGGDDEGEASVWAEVQATTPGGVRRTLAYEILMVHSGDRWEVVELSGTPTRVTAPAVDDDAPADGVPVGGRSTTTAG